jgi:DNA invertase Pin-like site-specific DNA recombinase
MGESLRTQKSQIEQAVKALNGTLINDPWRYSGQEHSTPQFERQRFEQLSKDASKGIFDAVIVVDPSRWSRDNLRSKQGLQTLRDHNIRFFTLQVEHDLFDPQAELFLGLSTEFNEYSAKIQAKKSMQNRIARALDGRPTSGRLPYGRTYDKQTKTWGIDKEKQKKIEWAAKEYLRGGHVPKIASALGLDVATLWRILTTRSGDTWEMEFKSKRLGIDQKVVLKVPRLLSRETIERIHAKAEANRTYQHGMTKYPYLLARVIFCAKCGLAFFGHTNSYKKRYYKRYYRHSRHLEQRKCDPSLWVRADELEQDVLIRLFATAGDSAGMEKAMLKAIPNKAKIRELRERKQFLESELSKVVGQKNRLIKSIAKGILSEEEAKTEITHIRSRESSVKAEIDSIEPQLLNMPTEEEIKRKAKVIQRIYEGIYNEPIHLAKMNFEERRRMISSFFAGKDSQGRRLGVYVKKDRDGIVHYEIRGAFQSFEGTVSPEGPDILSFPDVGAEYLEELIKVVRRLNKEDVSRYDPDALKAAVERRRNL